jgi:hemolysin activation/secretion protein
MLNLEANLSLPLNLKSVFFYDWGRVRVNRDNDFDRAPALNSLSLRGAGVSLAWDDGRGLSARLTWARRIGENPNPTAAGKDQDGTLVKNRIWLTAGYAL